MRIRLALMLWTLVFLLACSLSVQQASDPDSGGQSPSADDKPELWTPPGAAVSAGPDGGGCPQAGRWSATLVSSAAPGPPKSVFFNFQVSPGGGSIADWLIVDLRLGQSQMGGPVSLNQSAFDIRAEMTAEGMSAEYEIHGGFPGCNKAQGDVRIQYSNGILLEGAWEGAPETS